MRADLAVARQEVGRFRAAVKRRPLLPVAGEERQQFIAQARADFQDFALIGDAEGTIEDGVLVLRIDLRKVLIPEREAYRVGGVRRRLSGLSPARRSTAAGTPTSRHVA